MTTRVILWSFVVAVTLLDVGFTWANRQTFAEWEMNPVATLLARTLGLHAVLLFRLLSVGLGCVVLNLSRKSLRALGTAVVASVHFALLLVFVHGYVNYA